MSIHQSITNLQSPISNHQRINNRQFKNQQSDRSASRLPAGRMLTVAAQLDLVSRLFAVIAAVLPETSLRLDSALTGRVRTFRWSRHVDLRTEELYDSCPVRTSRAVGLTACEEIASTGAFAQRFGSWVLGVGSWGLGIRYETASTSCRHDGRHSSGTVAPHSRSE
jgi:hypothetical protein